MRKIFLILGLIAPLLLWGQTTEKIMLSGSGLGDTVEWDFFCTDGANAKEWKKIGVPSNWELEGFGEYTYGRWYKKPDVKNPSMEQGHYKYEFTLPQEYKDKQIDIVFDGVMTDAEVKINGKLAGAIHQGAFYRFSYDITNKVNFGKANVLEVKVSKYSADNSVNAAERKADWWLFGGIFRPVYLDIKPKQHIQHVALDAKADGKFNSFLTLSANTSAVKEVKLTLLDVNNRSLKTTTVPFKKDKKEKQFVISEQFSNIKTWTSETPNLYYAQFDLLDAKGNVIHTLKERFGFRTVEFKPQDGLYVNGTKVVLKGVNRHSFHPDGGRTTNRELSLQDVKLIKEMNINAVRFHYPPDKHFLDICDSLGLFVMDEFAGWQNSYRTEIGEKLLKAMIERDVNHPSIIIWSNGNEGGWNTAVDHLFAEYDPQKRHVVHPWADFNKFDTHHYPEYQTGVARFTNGYNVFMPTEFMHGMYDQGHGAGLEDFWAQYTAHPMFAGGFLWDFSDNAVRRVDWGGKLDTDNDHAADGILGPYREKEGSFYTIRELWSPIQIQPLLVSSSFDGTIYVKNDYLFSNLEGCSLSYEVLKINSPYNEKPSESVLASGKHKLGNIEPKETKKVKLDVPANFYAGDVLVIKAYNKQNEEVCTRTFPIKLAKEYLDTQLSAKADIQPIASEEGGKSILQNEKTKIVFDSKTGLILEVRQEGKLVPLTNGPIPLGMQAEYLEGKTREDAEGAYFTAKYKGMVDSIQWKLDKNGLLTMEALTLNRSGRSGGFDDANGARNISLFGFTFDYPEEKVKSVQWMGRGPYRVWRNRIPGTNYGLWEKEYNNTITGESDYGLVYPEFKGFHANLYWCQFRTDSPFTVYSESDGVYLHLFTPEEPKGMAGRDKTMPDFPSGDLSFLYEIPGIRDFKPLHQHGPRSQPPSIRIKSGDDGIKMILHFDFSK